MRPKVPYAKDIKIVFGQKMNWGKGFTLIELCIALAVTAILASLSVMTYGGLREKSNFRELQEIASKLALEQQHYRQKYQRYASRIESSGTSNNTFLALPGSEFYNFAITTPNSREFLATVSPSHQSKLTSSNCRSLVLRSNRGYLAYETRSASGQNTSSECL